MFFHYSYFDNNFSFFISKTTKEIQPSNNYFPKHKAKPKTIFLSNDEDEPDIIEEIIQNQKRKIVECEERNSFNSTASSSIQRDSYGTEQNVSPNGNSFIDNNTTNTDTNNNNLNGLSLVGNTFQFFASMLQNQLMHPLDTKVSFCNYNDETLVKLSPFLLKEQNGSRYLQKRINSDNYFANETFFVFIKNQYFQNGLTELICDQFGNYLFQSFIEALDISKRSEFLNMLEKDLYEISINTYGTRVIQKLISVIKDNEENLLKFIEMIQPIVLKLLKESHGNHIIQKFLEDVKHTKQKSFITNIIRDNFVKISTHKFGCCTIQKFLKETYDEDEKKINLLLVKKHIYQILSNQYGSYVFQYIIEKEDRDTKMEILNQILPHLIKICKTKYSSNAIEKCFEFHFEEIHNVIVSKICECNNNIKDLIMDPYGNYIIQKALCVCNKKHYDQIISIIGANTEKIKKLNFGFKLITKLLTQHKSLANYINNKFD
jgi:hypothetical protein